MREWRDEGRGSTVLDDASIEALFRNESVPEELAAVAGVVGVLRSAAQWPVQPSAELAERMATGDFGDTRPEPVATGRAAHRKPPQLSVRAKVAIGALASFCGLTAATVAGALPAPVQDGLEIVVELVTPIEIEHDVPKQDPPQEEPSDRFMGDGRINEPDNVPTDLAVPATPTPDQVGPVASTEPLDMTDAGGVGTDGELGDPSGDPTTDPTGESSVVPETPGPTTARGPGPDTPGLPSSGPPGLDDGGPPGLVGGGPPGLRGRGAARALGGPLTVA